MNLSQLSLANTVLATGLLTEADFEIVNTNYPEVFLGHPGVSEVRTFNGKGPHPDLTKVRPTAMWFEWAPAERRIIGLIKARRMAIIRLDDFWHPTRAIGSEMPHFLNDASGLNLYQPFGGGLLVNTITCPQLRANMRWIAGARVVMAESESWVARVAISQGVPVIPLPGKGIDSVTSLIGFLED